MPFEKFITGGAEKRKKSAKSAVAPNSVILPETLFGEVTALALHYGASADRIAEAAVTIGLRAIKARNDEFNRRAFADPTVAATPS